MAIRSLDDEMRFTVVEQVANHRNELPIKGVMGSGDADTLEVTG